VDNLDLGTTYYVVVTAENEFGEGYKAAPSMVMTIQQEVPLTLYVWGNNASNEIGISKEQVSVGSTYNKKNCMLCTFRQTSFQNDTVLQVACGNVGSLCLMVQPESGEQTIV
jgi:hypothetical protein